MLKTVVYVALGLLIVALVGTGVLWVLGRAKAQNCAEQLSVQHSITSKNPWHASAKPLVDGRVRWYLRVAPTDVRPLHLLVRSVEPSMQGLTPPVMLRSGKTEQVFYSEEVELGNFAISANSSFAHIEAHQAQGLREGRYLVRYPLQGDSKITQADGQRSFLWPKSHTKESGRYRAVDFAAELGTPVLAAKAGRVVLVEGRYADLGCGDLRFWGNEIKILHEDGTEATYAHLRQGSPRVAAGDWVQAGDVIAEVGNSGATLVPHLHFHVGALTESGFETFPLSFKCEAGSEPFLPTLGRVNCNPAR